MKLADRTTCIASHAWSAWRCCCPRRAAPG